MSETEPRPSQYDALRRARFALDDAITAPTADGAVWAGGVLKAVRKLGRVYQKHVNEAESDDGNLNEVLRFKPHMQRRVDQVRREHESLRLEIARFGELLVSQAGDGSVKTDDLRERAGKLEDALRMHQAKGADLLYEAHHRVEGGPG